MNILVTTKKGLGHIFERKKDIKKLGGKGRLTDTKTDTLQNYLSIAFRQNVGGIDKMISVCKASMFYVAGYHENCPRNQNSWCQYQQDILNGTSSYKDKGGLPLDLLAAILPVYNHVNQGIYQNVCMGIHKTKMKVLMKWMESCTDGQSCG